MKSAVNALDFSQFTSLRAEARSESPEATRKAAQQFEAMLTQQMLKSMRAASLGDDVLGGEQTAFYQDMFDQQISQHLAAGKGLGVADLLVRQLQGRESGIGSRESATQLQLSTNLTGYAVRPADTVQAFPITSVVGIGGASAQRAPAASASAEASATAPDSDWRPATAEQFVRDIHPYAAKAARELGIPERALIAQAALETGWGKHQIRQADGSPTFNLFGIKADNRWEGDQVTRGTREFENGGMQQTRAKFRAYDSLESAFDDYVDFLKSNPRYADALRNGGTAQGFAGGLQKAGYATDPAYADKILRITHGRTLRAALDVPAASPARTITV